MTPFLLICLCVVVQAQKPQSIQPIQANASLDSASTIASTPHLTYYGGRVLAHVKVFTIFWGGAVTYGTQMEGFYRGVTNSTYFDWLSEYNTANQAIGRGSYIGNFDYTAGATGTITDAQIQSTLKNLVATGQVHAPDLNTLYAIHFAPGITIVQGGDKSCEKFCAYHGTISYTKPVYLYYTVVPDQGGGCAGGCGGDPNPFNNLCSVSSHELVESVTDAGVGLATRTGPPLGWYDTTNGEIADICGSQQGKVKGGNGIIYAVQKVWSNKHQSCICKAPAAGSTVATAAPTTGTCSHTKCVTGGPLVATCDPCVQAVCAYDDWCCSNSWDHTCVGEIGLYCGLSCSAAPVSNAPTTCTHSHCSVGVKLTSDCDPCVAQICKKDPLCCNKKWDSVCVTEVKTYCNSTCTNTAPITQSDVNTRRIKTGVFTTFDSFPHGTLPHRADTLPPSGDPRTVIVTCAGNGSTCLNQTTANLSTSAFNFAPSAATDPQVTLFQVPANAKVHIGIHPKPIVPIYLYVYQWPQGEYTFTKGGKYEIQTSTTTSETTDHSIEVTSNDKQFSGILAFSAETEEIQWNAAETLDNSYLRFTLAYVVPVSN